MKLDKKTSVIFVTVLVLGTIIGNTLGFVISRTLSRVQGEKVYVITPDLLKSDIYGNTWKIGDKEFWNTSRGIEQDSEGHVVMTFEFTSKDILMQPK